MYWVDTYLLALQRGVLGEDLLEAAHGDAAALDVRRHARLQQLGQARAPRPPRARALRRLRAGAAREHCRHRDIKLYYGARLWS